MAKNFKNNRGGFIKIILIVVAALVLLKYAYNVDIVGFLTTGKPKEWLDWLYGLSSRIWVEYNPWIIKIWDYIIGFIKSLIDKFR